MAQRLRIEAVQQRTSEVSHILHNADPKSHLPTTAKKSGILYSQTFPVKIRVIDKKWITGTQLIARMMQANPGKRTNLQRKDIKEKIRASIPV